MHTKLNRLFLVVALALCSARCWGQEIAVSAAKPGGVYAVGEKIVWRLEVKGEGAAGIEKIGYVLRKGSRTEMGQGELALQNGAVDLETKLDEPGTIYAEFTATTADQKAIKNAAGAVIAPEKIEPSAPPPDDFDAFWQAKVEELAAVPTNPMLEPGDSGTENVDYWKITLDNIQGTKIRGQLARPKTGEKLPALLIVQWAGVYPLQKGWATGQAKSG
ncbi:MAG: acetylxylan esterase, partial [Armatimonadota bacterium]|nr:acetylxylan esterase [Armatimonadota bacterium]